MVVFVCIFVNAVLPGLLPKFEIFIIFFHIAGFSGVVATLWSFAPIGTTHFVFATSFNEGGWPTQGLSYCVGFLGNVATFVGADARVHMAEEVANAARNIPRAIIAFMCLNGAVGFTMMITTLFCLGDADSMLGTGFVYPFIQIFYNAVRDVAGATVMAVVVLALTWSCAIGITTTASRMTWSFARDKGTPFASFLGKVYPHNQIPVNSIFVVCALAMALQCIYFGSSVAFNDVVSLTITSFYCSYLIPCSMLLYHRIKGEIAPYSSRHLDGEAADSEAKIVKEGMEQKPEQSSNSSPPHSTPARRSRGLFIAQASLIWGPFSIPGIFGIINNAYACTYMVFVIFWSV
jgi:choline transport protein